MVGAISRIAATPAHVISESRILCFRVNRGAGEACAGGTTVVEATLTVAIVASVADENERKSRRLRVAGVNLLAVHKTAFLSLGSNIGDRMDNIVAALNRLREVGEITAVSSIYETEPVEFTAQPWFLNCVAELDIEKMPKQLLTAILKIEQSMGRRRQQKKGPRIIDIDILLFGNSVIDVEGLRIPHPSLHQRRFVLEPLAEIAPGVRHPVLKQTVRKLLAELPVGQTVRRANPPSDLLGRL